MNCTYIFFDERYEHDEVFVVLSSQPFWFLNRSMSFILEVDEGSKPCHPERIYYREIILDRATGQHEIGVVQRMLNGKNRLRADGSGVATQLFAFWQLHHPELA